jgi:hypothetical protein
VQDRRGHPGTQFGDVNLDGVVNAADAAIATGNLGSTTVGWAGGDINGDGIVDANDLAIIADPSSFACPVLRVADVDDGSATGTPDGGVTIDDLLYYLVRFESGC